MNATELSKACIVACGVGGWYPRGVDRLSSTLLLHNWKGGTLFFRDYPPGSPTHQENPYAFKIYAINEAIQKGYQYILWLDASVWAIKNPDQFFNYIISHGHYFFKTGYNLAQSCNDKILAFAGKTRDEAEKITEGATGCIGLNMEKKVCREFFTNWIQFMNNGLFQGSRLHAGQSEDPRFLFHRQDQSAASLIINHLGMKINDAGDFIAYTSHDLFYGTDVDQKKLTFLIQGM